MNLSKKLMLLTLSGVLVNNAFCASNKPSAPGTGESNKQSNRAGQSLAANPNNNGATLLEVIRNVTNNPVYTAAQLATIQTLVAGGANLAGQLNQNAVHNNSQKPARPN